MLWNGNDVDFKVVHMHKKFIHSTMSKQLGKSSKLTIIYASPCSITYNILWRDLESIIITNPWLIVKDINLVLYGYEQSFGKNLI